MAAPATLAELTGNAGDLLGRLASSEWLWRIGVALAIASRMTRPKVSWSPACTSRCSQKSSKASMSRTARRRSVESRISPCGIWPAAKLIVPGPKMIPKLIRLQQANGETFHLFLPQPRNGGGEVRVPPDVIDVDGDAHPLPQRHADVERLVDRVHAGPVGGIHRVQRLDGERNTCRPRMRQHRGLQRALSQDLPVVCFPGDPAAPLATPQQSPGPQGRP